MAALAEKQRWFLELQLPEVGAGPRFHHDTHGEVTCLRDDIVPRRLLLAWLFAANVLPLSPLSALPLYSLPWYSRDLNWSPVELAVRCGATDAVVKAVPVRWLACKMSSGHDTHAVLHFSPRGA